MGLRTSQPHPSLKTEMMKVILQECHIFSPVSCVALYPTAEAICIEKNENYQKRSFRNRYSILTSQGEETLSIPLKKGKNFQTNICDVKISYDERWVDKHLHSLRSAYGKSAYFEYYYPEIVGILSKNHTFLLDLNIESTMWILRKLKLDLPVIFTQEYGKVPMTDVTIVNWKKEPHKNTVSYTQVWSDRHEFVPSLSILDLLFCTGPAAINYTKFT